MNKIIYHLTLLCTELLSGFLAIITIVLFSPGSPSSSGKIVSQFSAHPCQKFATPPIQSPYLIIDQNDAVTGVSELGYEQREIFVPEGIVEITTGAFSRCQNLEYVRLPRSLKRIGWSAFEQCAKLQKINIPVGVDEIGDCVFRDCPNLKSGQVINNSSVIFDWWVQNHKYNNKTLAIMSEIDLSRYKNSANQPFCKIGMNAFLKCENLRKLVIPENILWIEGGNFIRSWNLTSEHVVNNSTVLFEWWVNNHRYPDGTIAEIIGRTNTINLTQYKNSANQPFRVIGGHAFSNRRGLETITIPSEIKFVDEFAFWSCSSLVKVKFLKGITKIKKSAFEYCVFLEEISLPDQLVEIGDYAFSYCTNLRNLIIPDSVTTLGNYAINNCVWLKQVVLPEKITKISEGLLTNCWTLTEIVVPRNVTEICQESFTDCFNLTKITLPNGLEKIGALAFNQCEELTSLHIPESVVSIAKGAFSNCRNLKELNLPPGVVELGDQIFANTDALEKIRLHGKNLSYQKELIERMNDHTHFYVADKKLADDLVKWRVDKKRVHLIASDEYVSINDAGTLHALTPIGRVQTELIVPDHATKIDDDAFKGCNNALKLIHIKSVQLCLHPFAFKSIPKSTKFCIDHETIKRNLVKNGINSDRIQTKCKKNKWTTIAVASSLGIIIGGSGVGKLMYYLIKKRKKKNGNVHA